MHKPLCADVNNGLSIYVKQKKTEKKTFRDEKGKINKRIEFTEKLLLSF